MKPKALAGRIVFPKREGLVTSTHGDFNLTDAGEALAKQLKDQAKAAQAAS